MTSNPYISRHYGSSMDVISNGHEDEVDAVAGYRRFPTAQHMTHTFFSPSKSRAAPSATAIISPTSLGIEDTYKSSTPDALAAYRAQKGCLIEGFPSRPLTPRGTNSITSLPPLLPAERVSLGHSNSFRDRGADLLRDWVRPTTSTSAPLSDDRRSQDINTTSSNGNAHCSFELVSQQATGQDGTSGQRNEWAALLTGAVVPAKHEVVSTSEAAVMSPSSESTCVAQFNGSTAGTLLAAPESIGNTTVDATLHRLRDALTQAQLVLNKYPLAGATRGLPQPPPLASHELEHQAQLTGPLQGVTSTFSPTYEKKKSMDSLEDVSPLVDTPEALDVYSPVECRVGVSAEGPFTTGKSKTTTMVGVPDETRFMVLCAVAHPAAIMARRVRRRGPAGAVAHEGQSLPADHPTYEVCAESGSRLAAPHRIAEVRSRAPAVSSFIFSEPATVAVEPQTATSSNANVEGPPSSRASTPRSAAKASLKHRQHEDLTVMPGLAEFLRAGNPNGFSSLSAVTHTKPSARPRAATSGRGLRRHLGHASAPAASSAVLVGQSPSSSLPHSHNGAVHYAANSVVTPPSQIPYTQREGTATTAVAVVSPPRRSASSRRIDSMPSYAQPTVSWLSKGSEASADVFPMSRVASPQTSPLKDPAAASRDGAPHEGDLL